MVKTIRIPSLLSLIKHTLDFPNAFRMGYCTEIVVNTIHSLIFYHDVPSRASRFLLFHSKMACAFSYHHFVGVSKDFHLLRGLNIVINKGYFIFVTQKTIG